MDGIDSFITQYEKLREAENAKDKLFEARAGRDPASFITDFLAGTAR